MVHAGIFYSLICSKVAQAKRDTYITKDKLTAQEGSTAGAASPSMTAETGLGIGKHFQRSREPTGASLTIALL